MDVVAEVFKVEKDIPMPTSGGRRGDFLTAVDTAIAQMEVGDSFAFSDDTKNGLRRMVVRDAAKKVGKTVTCRKVSDGQFRAWRTA